MRSCRVCGAYYGPPVVKGFHCWSFPSSSRTPRLTRNLSVNVSVEWIEVGRVTTPFGVKGLVRVNPSTDFPEQRLGTPGTRWLAHPQSVAAGGRRTVEPREIVLEQGREVLYKGQPCWLIKFQGYDTPEEVAGLRGFHLMVPDSDRPTLVDEDEYYINDLIGLDIVLKDTGETVGVIDDVFLNTGAHDLLSVRKADGSGTFFLPFVAQIVPHVDVKAGQVFIDPPEGLMELNVETASKKEKSAKGRQKFESNSEGEQPLDVVTKDSAVGDSPSLD